MSNTTEYQGTTINLNGHPHLPQTKTGSTCKLVSHSFFLDGKIQTRCFSLKQVAAIKEAKTYISNSDRDWLGRSGTHNLASPEELELLLQNNKRTHSNYADGASR